MGVNATEHWAEGFVKHINCVSCRSYDKPLSLYFHSGIPVDVKNTPIEELESRLDYIDAWCDDCKVYRSTRARAAGRLKTKKEAAAMAHLSKAKWNESPARFFVVKTGIVVYKQKFHEDAKNSPCALCGNMYFPFTMDFHHLLPKGGTVSVMAKDNGSLDSLIREMERCTLLCANCHRYVHYSGASLCLPLWKFEDHKERLLHFSNNDE